MGDFDRLILGLPPPPMPNEASAPETPPAPATSPSIGTPRADTSDTHDRFLRAQSHLQSYARTENLAAQATSVGSWFEGDSDQAQSSRMNYQARDVALSLAFLAFHESTNPEEKLRMARLFLDYARGYSETLRDLGAAGNLRHLSSGPSFAFQYGRFFPQGSREFRTRPGRDPEDPRSDSNRPQGFLPAPRQRHRKRRLLELSAGIGSGPRAGPHSSRGK